jgi:ribosome biogenesis GTPase
METGGLSEKIDRGKHTTRHSELFLIDEDSFICDTPGFTSLYLDDMSETELREYYPEIYEYEGCCKFNGCVHINEPVCGVKDALEEGKISQTRYENYKLLYEELKGKKKW